MTMNWMIPPPCDEIPVDLMAPEKSQIVGIFRQTLIFDGMNRSIVTYLPEGFCQNNRAVVVVPPANEDPVSFLKTSSLSQLADKEKILLVLLVPIRGQWDAVGRDAGFMNAVYKKIQGREYYVVMQDCIYAMGFADGVDVALEAVKTMTSEWSGLAIFGSPCLWASHQSSGYLDMDAGLQIEEMYISEKRAQLPVWMLTQEENDAVKQIVDYWIHENNNQETPTYDFDGTRIFMPAYVKDTWKINDDNIAQTRVTLGFQMEKLSLELLSRVWNYVGSARRHRGVGGKILRYFRSPLEHGATYHNMVVDGMKREWYEYVPKKVANRGVPVPLVCVFHGRGGNGETFFDITDMSLVAEERGFVAVFPTADIYQIRKGGFRGVRLWNGNQNGKPFDSLPFIREMIADVKSRISIDDGRIYACGQSSGGYMATYCALAASDIFAAVAPWSGLTMPGDAGDFSYPKKEMFTHGKVPIQLLVGKQDNIFGVETAWPLDEKPMLHRFIRFVLSKYHLQDEPEQYCCYPIDYYVWRNQHGVPMLKIGLVEDLPHANYPEQSWISYDQFLCKFRKDQNDKRYYMGQQIQD